MGRKKWHLEIIGEFLFGGGVSLRSQVITILHIQHRSLTQIQVTNESNITQEPKDYSNILFVLPSLVLTQCYHKGTSILSNYATSCDTRRSWEMGKSSRLMQDN
jgi:hypothetical protein